MGLFSWLFRRNKPKKIKIGLALGSGGAKGFAHLGALKAFEENGIEFDLIAGASIGSVVGAFYSAGYSSTDVSELLKRIDFGEIKNAFMIKMDTSGLFNVIDREIGAMNIEELPKPFKAVATEIESETNTFLKVEALQKRFVHRAVFHHFLSRLLLTGLGILTGLLPIQFQQTKLKKWVLTI